MTQVSEAEQLAHDAAVYAAFNAKENRKNIIFGSLIAGVVACVPAAASGWIAWAVYPRVETKIEFIPVAEDGTPIKAFAYDALPPEAKKRDIINSVVRYVLLREEFNEIQVGRNYETVSRMSGKDVQEAYQKANRIGAPTSQWNRYAPGGWVKVGFDSIIDEIGAGGYKDIPPAYTVRFCRQEKIKDRQAGRPEIWEATVTFKVVPGYDVRILATDNPGAIQVTEYREARPVGSLSNQPANGARGCYLS